MRTLKVNSAISTLFVLILTLTVFASCGSEEYRKIPLDSLDLKLKSTGSKIMKDILISFNHEKGAKFLLHKDYTTPMVHGRIMHNTDLYDDAYMMIPFTIGKVSQYKLFQVVDKGIVKCMRYKLTTDSDDMEFIEVMIDINEEYNLADFYLFVTSKDGMLKRQNILPAAIK